MPAGLVRRMVAGLGFLLAAYYLVTA
jgi:hypothetical protein